MVIDSAVLKNVSDELQAYVYMLVDLDSGVPYGHRVPARARGDQSFVN
jgi:hypothetical protein